MNKKKLYTGSSKPEIGARTVTVHLISEDPSVAGEHYELKHIIRHSPDGMNWGYLGSGPADCALSILVDHLGEEKLSEAEELYQYFKAEVISRFDGNLCVFSLDIEGWIMGFRSRNNKGEGDGE